MSSLPRQWYRLISLMKCVADAVFIFHPEPIFSVPSNSWSLHYKGTFFSSNSKQFQASLLFIESYYFTNELEACFEWTAFFFHCPASKCSQWKMCSNSLKTPLKCSVFRRNFLSVWSDLTSRFHRKTVGMVYVKMQIASVLRHPLTSSSRILIRCSKLVSFSIFLFAQRLYGRWKMRPFPTFWGLSSGCIGIHIGIQLHIQMY